jgi:putative ABC transport system ATP-binding protein
MSTATPNTEQASIEELVSQYPVYCRGLTKSFKTSESITTALRGVDLAVRRGEIMMLVGPSGCGKTTLISVIAGILNHDSGECWVDGMQFDKMTETQRSKQRGKHLGFVFQAFNLIPTLTVAQNVAVPLLIQGQKIPFALKKAEAMLKQVGLGQKLTALPKSLSGGQQQRVAIARALVHEPSIVVCDEPTSALDQDTGHQIMELLREQARARHCTLIIVTHDSRIFEFADRLAEMNDGHIEKISEISTLKQEAKS